MAVETFALTGDGNALSENDSGKLFVLKTTVTCSTNGVTAANVVKLWDIPANTLVTEVIANVRTAEGGTLTIDVGDYLDADDTAVNADGFLDGINGNSAAASKSLGLDVAYGGGGGTNTYGKFYTAATAYIGALFNNTADTAVIDFIAICMDCR